MKRLDIFRYYLNLINIIEFEEKFNIPLILQAIAKDNFFMFYVFVKLGCNVNIYNSLLSVLEKNNLGYVKRLILKNSYKYRRTYNIYRKKLE